MLQSSAYRTNRCPRRASSSSSSLSTMFESNGESGPPCGTPSSVLTFTPSGITTLALSIRPIRAREPLVVEPLCKPPHQALMMNSIEEFLQIQVHHPVVCPSLRSSVPPQSPSGSSGLDETRGSIHGTLAHTPVQVPAVPPPVPFDRPRSESPARAVRLPLSVSTRAGYLRDGSSHPARKRAAPAIALAGARALTQCSAGPARALLDSPPLSRTPLRDVRLPLPSSQVRLSSACSSSSAPSAVAMWIGPYLVCPRLRVAADFRRSRSSASVVVPLP